MLKFVPLRSLQSQKAPIEDNWRLFLFKKLLNSILAYFLFSFLILYIHLITLQLLEFKNVLLQICQIVQIQNQLH